MKYNQDKINKLCYELKKSLANLHRLSRLEKKAFISDPDKTGSAKYNFIIAIEAAIDLCNHIIANKMYRTPEDYADTFRVMQEVGVFTEKFTDSLVQMAKFRNRLVHIYWDIDEEMLHTFMQNDLMDLEQVIIQLGKIFNSD
ncbi:Uncharacterized conserved protein YutE, UPF0331/DUF86 family [Desulfotomaculum arcticum]|uniref:Uncharacterized conserved protein YutE, UPF0331/DUF86 family n=1 Tax=Desulfotruncus arcticus DSM 17038 TaxID=1121424 RepID=A0A1I2MX08_9FIRM|nr:DUF86 domain-containing protein [Desulfotruncus arcticus]SFF95648.1 Uncharacterized conserved protein YutE, UPF0331/DUF86 family [Desulfotomaculum arcticum] [Desulfotruncus arcticus DSM 17038]